MTVATRPPIGLAATATVLTAPAPPPSRYSETVHNRFWLVIDADARNELTQMGHDPALLMTCRTDAHQDTDIDAIRAALGNPSPGANVTINRATVERVNRALHEGPVARRLHELGEDPQVDTTINWKQVYCTERAMAEQTVHLALALGHTTSWGSDLNHGSVAPAPWKS